ncbi:FAD-binding protein [Halodesulfurarchaeum sp.]|uniref:FAD-binding protein n=1 Tax=Halodesulfurarchaeum sp. TaxID=1980530 RepID=UPI002FC38438
MTERPNFDDYFDAIVVGAGLAGSAAALTMAQQDLEVLLIERGNYPGAKNVFGGTMYTPRIRELTGEGFEDAPVERHLGTKRFGLLSTEDETAMSIKPGQWQESPHNDTYTVLRGNFDEWFADQAIEAGATLITETTVTDLVREGESIVGVETDRPDGTIHAPMVVLAEGGNSLVSEAADLKETDPPEKVAIGVKEVRKYDRETIEERFGLGEDDGAAYHYFGEGACGGGVGGGFIYTNKRTLAIGVAYTISDAIEDDRKPDELLSDFKEHPAVAPLVKGGRVVEYSAKSIPEGGASSVPELAHDGAVIIGDAASLLLNNGIHLEGTNMAVESGYLAGNAIVEAIQAGRTDAAALQSYPEELESSYVMENLQNYDWFSDFAHDEKQFLFQQLPKALTEAELEFFKQDYEPKETHAKRAKNMLLRAAGGWTGAAKKAWKYRKLLS